MAYKSLVGYTSIKGYPSSIGYIKIPNNEPTDNYENIVFIGASITEHSFGRDLVTPNPDATSYLNVDGVNVYGYGWSGYKIAELLPKISEAMSVFPEKTLFVPHVGGNDVSGTYPYATMTQTELDNFNADLDSLYSLIAPRINDFIVADLTFRNYDSATLYDQANGSRPYIDFLYAPRRIAKFTNSDGNSVVDYYNHVRNNYSWMLSADNVHMSPAGIVELREFGVDRIRYLISGGSMPAPVFDTIPPYVPPVGDDKAIIVNFGDPSFVDGFTGEMVDSTAFVTGNSIPLKDVSGDATPYTISFSVKNSSDQDITVSTNTNGVDLGGVFENSLMSNPIHKSTLWWNPNDKIFITISGLTPGEQIALAFVGTRVTGTARFTEIIDDSDSLNFVEYATSNSIPDDPAVLQLLEKGLGSVTFKVDAKSGTAYAYMGGIQVTPII